MDDDKPRPEIPRVPRKLGYPLPLPLPLPITEENQRYAEAGKKIDETIAQLKRRRRGLS